MNKSYIKLDISEKIYVLAKTFTYNSKILRFKSHWREKLGELTTNWETVNPQIYLEENGLRSCKFDGSGSESRPVGGGGI